MEIPLASAKMTTSAVMKHFMAGLGVWPEWLWNTVTVGARANNEREGNHTLRYFQGVVPRSVTAATTRTYERAQRDRHHDGGHGPDREGRGLVVVVEQNRFELLAH